MTSPRILEIGEISDGGRRMTEYKCKCGFKIDVPEDECHNEELVSIAEPEIRAFCAFCGELDNVLLKFGDEGAKLVIACDFLRADLSWDDLSWDDWRDDTFDDWEDEE